MDSINNINNKITKLFQNPNINFFIIMMLILIISSYTLINTSLKYSISSFVANPIIILSVLISVVLIGYYNVNIAVLVLLLLFVALYGTTIFNSKNRIASDNKNNPVEGFTDDTEKDEEYEESEEDEEDFTDNESDDETDDEHDVKLSYPRNPRITKSSYKETEDKDAKTEETVNKIKNTILGTMNNIKDVGNNEYQKSLLENKKIQYLNEKKNNRNNNSNNRKSKNSKQNFTNTGSSSKKENFHTINIRKFDPNKEEDTNFLITKEILQDMITRIDYNYESSPYLKKYLKHRVEEIVDLNKLLEDDD